MMHLPRYSVQIVWVCPHVNIDDVAPAPCEAGASMFHCMIKQAGHALAQF